MTAGRRRRASEPPGRRRRRAPSPGARTPSSRPHGRTGGSLRARPGTPGPPPAPGARASRSTGPTAAHPYRDPRQRPPAGTRDDDATGGTAPCSTRPSSTPRTTSPWPTAAPPPRRRRSRSPGAYGSPARRRGRHRGPPPRGPPPHGPRRGPRHLRRGRRRPDRCPGRGLRPRRTPPAHRRRPRRGRPALGAPRLGRFRGPAPAADHGRLGAGPRAPRRAGLPPRHLGRRRRPQGLAARRGRQRLAWPVRPDGHGPERDPRRVRREHRGQPRHALGPVHTAPRPPRPRRPPGGAAGDPGEGRRPAGPYGGALRARHRHVQQSGEDPRRGARRLASADLDRGRRRGPAAAGSPRSSPNSRGCRRSPRSSRRPCPPTESCSPATTRPVPTPTTSSGTGSTSPRLCAPASSS